MTTITRGSATVEVSVLREKLRDVLDDVLEHGKRRVIVRHGRPVAAIVPLGALQALEASDKAAADALRAEAAQRAPGRLLSVEEAIAKLRDVPRGADIASLAPEDGFVILGNLANIAKERNDLLYIQSQLDLFNESDSASATHTLYTALRELTNVMLRETQFPTRQPFAMRLKERADAAPLAEMSPTSQSKSQG